MRISRRGTPRSSARHIWRSADSADSAVDSLDGSNAWNALARLWWPFWPLPSDREASPCCELSLMYILLMRCVLTLWNSKPKRRTFAFDAIDSHTSAVAFDNLSADVEAQS